MVVFTGEAEFKSDLGPQLIHLAELLEFVGREREKVLDERQMAYVVGCIEMKRLRRSLETKQMSIISITCEENRQRWVSSSNGVF